MNDKTTPKWVQHGVRVTPDALGDLLSYARQNYVAHTDWYLRHRDAGIKLLSVILIANVTIGGLYFDSKLPAALTILALGVLAVLSLALTFLATRSCRQAYSAALEHALLASKAAWAMGFAQPVDIPEYVC